ncbi:MAG: M14 family metallopeptidase [Flavisolibacter sp.]
MIRKLTVLLLFLLCLQTGFSQIQTPEQFLGYKIGTRFTPHHRILDYFNYIATSAPAMVKVEKYGETYEHRPLMVAYVSSAENIGRLESIRQNNLELTGQGTADANQPAIVWLSYNVHGNEASSSEAAMLTLYALVNPGNTQTKNWLQNTVVVMDPCLNPDGRDRYVNWYNSVAGANYNPALASREHREPWPGGRSNHYYFDLNRDWAWQTQTESRSRIQLYQKWYPQVHVDFHEQGVNNPYYFAPAAEPFHEVITPWQREFQNTIGRNHARYFDENGWLYFTKERFDLLYPSYGDTYPIYNGSIGMTYEQAGGPAGGLGAMMETGDTLTLTDRALHHFTTGMSTIETASKNKAQLLSAFQQYFSDAASGKGNVFQSYVIKTKDSRNVNAFLDLLRNNNIQFYNGRTGSARGYNYDTRREESFQVSSDDIVVPSAQTSGTLLSVLMDPDVKLSDSATYDITAWALPYAYGLKAFAAKEKIQTTNYNQPAAVTNNTADPYAYVIRWNGMEAVKLASELLQQGIRFRFTETPFTSGGQSFDRGSLVVLKTGIQNTDDLWARVRTVATKYNVPLVPVASGMVDLGFDFGSGSMRPMKAPRVALASGDGVSSTGMGEIWHFFDQQLHYPVTVVNSGDLGRVNWSDFDVVILPSGNYSVLSDKNAAEKVKNWVSSGGVLIALENTVAQLSKLDWGLKTKKQEEEKDADEPYDALKKYESRERDVIPATTPGSVFRVELDNSHPLAFGYPNHYYTLKQDGQLYNFIKNDGWNVGVIKKDSHLSGFVGADLNKKLEDALVIGVQEIGRGQVVNFADDVLFRSFWENGKQLFANAVFLVGQ